jgi:hypothetical protein
MNFNGHIFEDFEHAEDIKAVMPIEKPEYPNYIL